MGLPVNKHSAFQEQLLASSEWLSKLEFAQGDLERCIAAFEEVVQCGVPNIADFGIVRLRLCKANLARTQIAREACSVILRAAPHSSDISDLELREIEHFQSISRHVQRWTSNKLLDQWAEYCSATRELLERTRDLVASEKELLMPLLRWSPPRPGAT